MPSQSPRWLTTPSTRCDPHSVFCVILSRLAPPGSRYSVAARWTVAVV